MPHCPTDEQLAIFVAGGALDRESATLANHLAHCAKCRKRVELERSNQDWLNNVRPDSDKIETLAAKFTKSTAPDISDNEPLDVNTPISTDLTFDGYQLEGQLAIGGQSIIFKAIQESTGQRVAIKLPREGRYITKAERLRFQREIELVTQLKHGHIISIFDSGLTDDGRRYYVMDFVDGQHLHRYVRQQGLTLEEALRLFCTVCDAVQFAHLRGVIHRDLKPANILVDQHGNPKILDFGLARGMKATAQTAISMAREVFGTLPYMSPEQADGRGDEIDTRTDVYALGVILYELLTGTYPYTVTGSVIDVLRTIVDTEPAPPAKRWNAKSGLSASARTRLRHGQCPINDELNTIILKALAKAPERRYQSASDLASDLRRYLAGDPIEAKSDSGWYLMRKAIRRHRTVAGATASVFAVTILALLVITSFWRDAARARDSAQDTLDFVADVWPEVVDPLIELEFSRIVDTASSLDALFEKHPDQVGIPEPEGGRTSVYRAADTRLSMAMRTNRLHNVFATFATGPDNLADLLTRLDGRFPERAWQQDVRQRAGDWLVFPMPVSHIRTVLDARSTLAALWPADPRPSIFDRRYDGRVAQLALVLEDDFTACASLDTLAMWGWDLNETNREWVSIEESNPHALVIRSREKYGAGTQRPMPTEQLSNVIMLSLDFRLRRPHIAEEANAPPGAVFSLILDGCESSAKLAHEFERAPELTINGRPWPMHRCAKVDSWKINLWMNRTTRHVDMVVNQREHFQSTAVPVSDNRPHAGPTVRIESSGNTEVLFDRLTVRSGDVSLSDPAALVVSPSLDNETSAFSHVAQSRIPHIGLVTHDLDHDGIAEVITGDHEQTHLPRCYRAVTTPTGIVLESLDVWSDWLAEDVKATPLGMLGDRLVCAFEQPHTRTDTNAPPCKLGLVSVRWVEDTLVCEPPAFFADWDELSRNYIVFSPLKLPDNRSGFVIGTGAYRRCIDVFEFDADGSCNAIASIPARIDAAPQQQSDVTSIKAADLDRDGVDDQLFVGLAHWQGFCAADITIYDLLRSDTTPVLLRRIGGSYGSSCVLPIESDDAVRLLAASSREWLDLTTNCGLRLWRVGDSHSDPVLCDTHACNATRVATTQIDNQRIVALLSVQLLPKYDCQNLTISLFRQNGDTLDPLWSTTHHDLDNTPGIQSTSLEFVEFDGRDGPELLVGLWDSIIVFSGLNRPALLEPRNKALASQ